MTDITPLKFSNKSDRVEYRNATNNRFSIQYTRSDAVSKDEISIILSYQRGTDTGIRLKTLDGREIKHGEVLRMEQLSKENKFKSQGNNREKGKLGFLLDITENKRPRLDWEEVEFTILYRGENIGTFKVSFGGYPNVEDDYDKETGEFEI